MMVSNRKPDITRLTPQEGLAKIYKYCAYQERSHQEVRDKLFDYGLHSEDVEALLSRLITEGFLNEERFAKAFAGGKFRVKKWGRLKIQHELEHRGLTRNCISGGLKEIGDSDYQKSLKDVVKRKADRTQDANLFRKRDKVARFAIAKGYEPDLVWEIVKELFPA